MSITLQRAEKFYIPTIEKILQKENLPYQDVNAENIKFFMAFGDNEFVGIVGLENYSDVALLRSMVVFDNFKKKGFGRKIVNYVLEEAKAKGIKEIFILTTTAKEFFERRGFEVIERESVPDDIKSTTEFTSLCPASATCMRINLQINKTNNPFKT